jgi:hypothetical protein
VTAAADRAKAAEVRDHFMEQVASRLSLDVGEALPDVVADVMAFGDEYAAAARADARREQQIWDRRRVEHYAETVHVELTPGDDLGDAVNELYLAARADERQRWVSARDDEAVTDAIREWAAPDEELGWPGSPEVAQHAEEIAAFLWERGLTR